MIRAGAGVSCRWLILAASALLPLACSTTSTPPTESVPAPKPTAADHRTWEETTRARVDDLMSEAQALLESGEPEAAVWRTDEALCEVLDAPPGYPVNHAYLDYLAELIDEADAIEATLRPFDGEPAGNVDDLVILPPIDIVDLSASVEEAIEEGGLPASDLPLVLNPNVESFLAAMSSEGEFNRRIALGLQRSGTYLPMIRERLAAAGLPLDLSYLPLIESAFSIRAYSRARAHGMWQFISSTAKHYGLEVGPLVDERRDPERSTEAAAAYLSDLYAEFNDWYLALAAYNSGAGNVRRAIRRSGSEDFWTLRGYLPRETRNYVPAFIASVIVAKRPAAFGFPAVEEQPWEFDSLDVPDALDLQFLSTSSGISLDALRELNPAIRRDLTPAGVRTALRLPRGTAETARAVLEATPRSKWAPRMVHTVRSGDSLYTIARRYGSTVDEIRQANGLRGSLIHPGQDLVVPRFGSAGSVPAARSFSGSADGTYVVQRNDTLWDIARGFGVSLDALCRDNDLSRRSVIRPGQRLRIPAGGHGGGPDTAPDRQPAAARGIEYVVRPGDTLFDIARLHGVTVSALRQANRLDDSRIHPNDVLRIPQPTAGTGAPQSAAGGLTHRVRPGDTLYDIARRYGVSVQELQRYNNLRSSRIHPGDLIRIPGTQAQG